MRLLSDFDGVWTHPREEAAAQGAVLDGLLVEWVEPAMRADAAARLAEIRVAVRANPERYGWAPGGRLSAFGDEDPFAEHSGVLHYMHLHAGEDPVVRAMQEGVRQHGHDSLEGFGGWCHKQGVQKVEEARGPAILAGAAAAGRALLESGTEIVLVSNSGTDKLVRWFTHAGVPNTVHPERPAGSLWLRGGARKFVLDPSARETLQLGALAIESKRPHYEEILREELPQAVVGDVFSLDLALPLQLRRREPAWRDVRLFWLARDYASALVRRALEAHAPEVEIVEDGLEGVAARLKRG